jgi:hypothetical protein
MNNRVGDDTLPSLDDFDVVGEISQRIDVRTGVGFMTQLWTYSRRTHLKSSEQTFVGTRFTSQKTSITTVDCCPVSRVDVLLDIYAAP